MSLNWILATLEGADNNSLEDYVKKSNRKWERQNKAQSAHCM